QALFGLEKAKIDRATAQVLEEGQQALFIVGPNRPNEDRSAIAQEFLRGIVAWIRHAHRVYLPRAPRPWLLATPSSALIGVHPRRLRAARINPATACCSSPSSRSRSSKDKTPTNSFFALTTIRRRT